MAKKIAKCKSMVVIDRDDELLAVITHEPNYDQLGQEVTLRDGPLTLSSESLMGTMPKAERIIKKDILWKLTSTHEWKPMQIVSKNRFYAKLENDRAYRHCV